MGVTADNNVTGSCKIDFGKLRPEGLFSLGNCLIEALLAEIKIELVNCIIYSIINTLSDILILCLLVNLPGTVRKQAVFSV